MNWDPFIAALVLQVLGTQYRLENSWRMAIGCYLVSGVFMAGAILL